MVGRAIRQKSLGAGGLCRVGYAHLANRLESGSMLRPIALSLTLFTSALAGSAGAQDASNLSPQEIEELFKKQRTRGLVLAPTNDTAAATTEQTTSQTTTSVAATSHVELPKDVQVNIQVSFDFDSAALRADQKPKLSALCQAMKSSAESVFRVVGHTDSSGSADYNERLSLLRAEEVKRYLVDDCGIPSGQLQAVGVGEQFPYNATDPRADENRRVEFQALS